MCRCKALRCVIARLNNAEGIHDDSPLSSRESSIAGIWTFIVRVSGVSQLVKRQISDITYRGSASSMATGSNGNIRRWSL